MRFLRGCLIFVLVGIFLLLVGPFLVPVPPLEGTAAPTELADADSQFMEINDLTVHYKRMGQGEPVMILLHGFGASTYSWREVMQPLAEYGTVIAFDRPAFGLTERPLPDEFGSRNPYTPDFQVELVFGLMDALNIQQAVLIGNSAGGTVAANAALAQPDRVAALVMVDAAVYAGGGPGWIRPLLRTPQMDHLGPLVARSLAGERGDTFLRSAWHDPNRISEEVIENYRRPLQVENWDRALWELTKVSRESDLPERLSDLTMPILVITGDDDRIVATDDSIRLAGEMPDAELVVLENCGHLPQEECPDSFLQAVIPFLERVQ